MESSLQTSIEKHESYIKADPHNALLWVAMGDLYHRAGRLEEALASFERSQLEAPESPAAKSRIASVRISQHRFAEAESILRELAGAQPDSAALLYNLGLTQFYQDKWREAQASFDRALALGLKTRDNLAYLTRSLHHLGKTREAIGSCEQWLGQAPGARPRAAPRARRSAPASSASRRRPATTRGPTWRSSRWTTATWRARRSWRRTCSRATPRTCTRARSRDRIRSSSRTWRPPSGSSAGSSSGSRRTAAPGSGWAWCASISRSTPMRSRRSTRRCA